MLDQDEEELGKSKNPFAFIILTVLLALKKRENDKNEEGLLKLKVELTRKLLESKFPKPVIRGIYYFIRNYVVFENKENDRKFNNIIESVTNNNKSIGIVEMIIEREKKAILEEGIEKGREESKTEFVKNLLATNKFTVVEIANFASVTEAFVRKVKKISK